MKSVREVLRCVRRYKGKGIVICPDPNIVDLVLDQNFSDISLMDEVGLNVVLVLPSASMEVKGLHVVRYDCNVDFTQTSYGAAIDQHASKIIFAGTADGIHDQDYRLCSRVSLQGPESFSVVSV